MTDYEELIKIIACEAGFILDLPWEDSHCLLIAKGVVEALRKRASNIPKCPQGVDITRSED